jgi:prepilin-type N-terminal cleavage/methylation domain-containing protein
MGCLGSKRKCTMRRKQNKKGFTLAELLIVVAIIAVLVAI